MSVTFWRTAGLLVISNTFMTFAWYALGSVVHSRRSFLHVSLAWRLLSGRFSNFYS